MTRQVRTVIRYDGPALVNHEMEVQDLAPALLALADVVQLANRKFNGQHADIKVLVNADVEQRCFMIEISLIQSFLDQARNLLGTEDVKTAKDIAEFLGIIGAPIGAAGAGLFALLKFLRRTKGDETSLQIESNGDGNVTVTGNGNTIIVRQEVIRLAHDPQIVEKTKAVLKPLERDGYETLSFIQDDDEIVEITSAEAEGIRELSSQPLADVPSESISEIRGQVRIKSAQYEGSAQWAFLWNGRSINAEMIDAAASWVEEFQANLVEAPPNTILDVTMIETARLDANGLIVGKPTYKVLEVLSATPPPRQLGLLDR